MTNDNNSRQIINALSEAQWFDAEIRPLGAADAGLLIVGRTHSLWFVGQVAAGGEVIVPLPGAAVGEPDVPGELVVVYALLDPPLRIRD